jgi:hypothetical protein
MNYLHQEKFLRDHGIYRRLILPVNPILGDIAAKAAAVRVPRSNPTSRNPQGQRPYRVGPGGHRRTWYGCPRAGLPRWVTHVHGRQVLHLVFGEAEVDKERPDLRHGADRDSHFLAAPHVPLLEQHVGDLVAARFHD